MSKKNKEAAPRLRGALEILLDWMAIDPDDTTARMLAALDAARKRKRAEAKMYVRWLDGKPHDDRPKPGPPEADIRGLELALALHARTRYSGHQSGGLLFPDVACALVLFEHELCPMCCVALHPIEPSEPVRLCPECGAVWEPGEGRQSLTRHDGHDWGDMHRRIQWRSASAG